MGWHYFKEPKKCEEFLWNIPIIFEEPKTAKNSSSTVVSCAVGPMQRLIWVSLWIRFLHPIPETGKHIRRVRQVGLFQKFFFFFFLLGNVKINPGKNILSRIWLFSNGPGQLCRGLRSREHDLKWWDLGFESAFSFFKFSARRHVMSWNLT